MTMHIVKFLKENVVEAVPSAWYISLSSECFWPPIGTKTIKVIKYIENAYKLGDDWKVHDVKLLGTYADYQQAQQKAKKAMFTSDISSANEFPSKHYKRKRKQNPKYYNKSSDDANSSDSECAMFPVLKKSCHPILFDNEPTSRIRRSRSLSSQRQVLCDKTDKDKSIENLPSTSNNLSNNLSTCNIDEEEASFTSKVKNMDDSEFKRVVLKELSVLSIQVSSVQETLTNLLHMQKINSVANSINATTASLSDGKKLNDSLPLHTINDLEALEQWIKKEEKNYDVTVSEFRRIGGQSAAQHTRKILYKIFSNEVAMLFSWDGHKQKKALKTYDLARCILDAVKIQYPQILESDVISVIKIFLVKAKERAANKTQQD